jgi:hypothetical protein
MTTMSSIVGIHEIISLFRKLQKWIKLGLTLIIIILTGWRTYDSITLMKGWVSRKLVVYTIGYLFVLLAMLAVV